MSVYSIIEMMMSNMWHKNRPVGKKAMFLSIPTSYLVPAMLFSVNSENKPDFFGHSGLVRLEPTQHPVCFVKVLLSVEARVNVNELQPNPGGMNGIHSMFF